MVERVRLLGAPLPGGAQVDDPAGRYRFLAPWPFAVAGGGGPVGGDDPELIVAAPRSDGSAVELLLRSSAGGGALDRERNRRLAKYLEEGSGADVDGVERIGIDGRQAVLATGRDRAGGSRTVLLLAPHDRFTIYGRADLPPAHADGYLLLIRSMLASWRWTGAG